MGIMFQFGDAYFKNIKDEMAKKYLNKGAQFLLECNLPENFLFSEVDCYLIGAFYSVHINTGFVEVNWIDDILFDSIKKYPIRYLKEHDIYNPIDLENFAVYFSDILWTTSYKKSYLTDLKYREILLKKFQHLRPLSDLYNGVY